MITSVRMVNFKNFANETLKVGPFTVIMGANASGKSNIRDAFRFLHGIGRGYTLVEILGGKYGPGGQREWTGIRGAPNEIIRIERRNFSVGIEAPLWDTDLRYFIDVDYDFFNDGKFRVKSEILTRENSTVFGCHRDGQGLVLDVGDVDGRVYPMNSSDPFLSDVAPTYWPPGEATPVEDPAVYMKDALANLHFLEPIPDRMREPAFPEQAWETRARTCRRCWNLFAATLPAKKPDVLASGTHPHGRRGLRLSARPQRAGAISTSLSAMAAECRPTAPRTAPCASWAFWRHCSAPTKVISTSLRTSTMASIPTDFGS